MNMVHIYDHYDLNLITVKNFVIFPQWMGQQSPAPVGRWYASHCNPITNSYNGRVAIVPPMIPSGSATIPLPSGKIFHIAIEHGPLT
jgi:hypothetical protein